MPARASRGAGPSSRSSTATASSWSPRIRPRSCTRSPRSTTASRSPASVSTTSSRISAAMGGQSDEIRRFLKDHHKEGMELGDAVQLGVRALTVTQNKTLTERDLEVAVLDRTKARRKFRRIPLEALGQLLGTAR